MHPHCRRKTCRYTEERRDAEVRPCPGRGYKLSPTGKVRHIRFHDLRQTYASVLLMFGANLVSVQKLLGHSDPKITERRYGHMLPSLMKTEVDRLRFGLDQLAPRLDPPSEGGMSQALAGVPPCLGTKSLLRPGSQRVPHCLLVDGSRPRSTALPR